jgi:hypothetical protein
LATAAAQGAATAAARQPVALDFGPSYRPGYLPHPEADEAAGRVANLPAATGTGIRLPPARLHPDSCAPPPFLEPFAPSSAVQKYQVASQQAAAAAAAGGAPGHVGAPAHGSGHSVAWPRPAWC